MKTLSIPTWNKKGRETRIALIAAAVLAFFFLLNSPIHLWRRADTETDSSVFKTVAMMMDKGYMPYKDTFDHKGPLIYAINYWGLKISYYRGVWLFEAICMTITLFMLYKIARLRTKITSSVLVVLTAMGLLFDCFQGGNYTEEYAMPFIAISEYIFLDYLLNEHLSRRRIAISGFSMGVACMLKPNTIAVWIVFCVAIFFRKLFEKDWKQLGQFVLWFLIGFSVVVLPCIVWLAANGALQACIEDYILFNILYSSPEGGTATQSAKWISFFRFASRTVYLIALIGIAYHLKEKPFLNITYMAYMITGLILVSLSGKIYGYYGLTLVPIVVYPLSLIMQEVERLTEPQIARVIKILITVYMMSTVIVPKSIDTIKNILPYYLNRNGEQFDETMNEICNTVSNLTSEDEAISVYGSMDFIYVKTHRKHATLYSYQYPIGWYMPEIIDKYMEQLSDELPPIIVVQDLFHNSRNIRDFLKKNDYELVWPTYITEEDELDEIKTHSVFYRSQDVSVK